MFRFETAAHVLSLDCWEWQPNHRLRRKECGRRSRVATFGRRNV